MDTKRKFSISSWLRSPVGLVVFTLLAMVALYFAIEHTAHVFDFLPYMLLLLCPLLHLFMHGGPGWHSGHDHK
jgi:hypothetical protein